MFLLPKQVRYQAALRPDVNDPFSVSDGFCQGERRGNGVVRVVYAITMQNILSQIAQRLEIRPSPCPWTIYC